MQEVDLNMAQIDLSGLGTVIDNIRAGRKKRQEEDRLKQISQAIMGSNINTTAAPGATREELIQQQQAGFDQTNQLRTTLSDLIQDPRNATAFADFLSNAETKLRGLVPAERDPNQVAAIGDIFEGMGKSVGAEDNLGLQNAVAAFEAGHISAEQLADFTKQAIGNQTKAFGETQGEILARHGLQDEIAENEANVVLAKEKAQREADKLAIAAGTKKDPTASEFKPKFAFAPDSVVDANLSTQKTRVELGIRALENVVKTKDKAMGEIQSSISQSLNLDVADKLEATTELMKGRSATNLTLYGRIANSSDSVAVAFQDIEGLAEETLNTIQAEYNDLVSAVPFIKEPLQKYYRALEREQDLKVGLRKNVSEDFAMRKFYGDPSIPEGVSLTNESLLQYYPNAPSGLLLELAPEELEQEQTEVETQVVNQDPQEQANKNFNLMTSIAEGLPGAFEQAVSFAGNNPATNIFESIIKTQQTGIIDKLKSARSSLVNTAIGVNISAASFVAKQVLDNDSFLKALKSGGISVDELVARLVGQGAVTEEEAETLAKEIKDNIK